MFTHKHLYLEIDGVKYYDCDMYAKNCPYYGTLKDDDYQIIDSTTKRRLDKLDGIVDDTLKPEKGSSLFIVPVCSINLQSIRNNYTIKRTSAAADYVVFSPGFAQKGFAYRYGDAVYIPSRNAVCVHEFKYNNRMLSNPRAFAESFFPDLAAEEDVVHIAPSSPFLVCQCKLTQPYIDALTGKEKKPCVNINNLDLTNDLDVSVDLFNILYKVLTVSYREVDAEKNALIQLNVLNSHNWREYIGAISILFGCIRRKCNTNIYNEMRSHRSKYSKDIQALLKLVNTDFCCEKDFYFAQEFVNNILHIDDCKFAVFSDVVSKLSDVGITEYDFQRLYSPIVRITPKKYVVNEQE